MKIEDWRPDELVEAICESNRRKERYEHQIGQEVAHQEMLYDMLRDALNVLKKKAELPRAFE